MKEPELYMGFLRRNFLILLIPLLIGILISSFLLSGVKSQTKISQSFRMVYNLEDVDLVLALTDQAVSELRAQRFKSFYSEASDSIYKSGPLAITIDTVSIQKETAYELLLKNSVYLHQNFSVIQLNQPEISQLEPSIAKYLITGSLTGFLLGFVVSLIKEYFKNY